MNDRPALSDLNAFLAIAGHRSFRKAADELGVSPSTLSHMMRTLEANMGVRLLNRTTRSVSPTQVGERLVTRLQPVLRELDSALDEVDQFRGSPGGTLRINASEPAARLLMADAVPRFLALYPQMSLDLATEGRLVDIVAEGFDAGVRLGEALPQDMIAVRVGGDMRFVPVASPAYLAGHPAPESLAELEQHHCIRIRLPSGKPYSRWEFEQQGKPHSVEVGGALVLDNIGLMVDAALQGLGIAFVPEHMARPHVETGRLTLLLDDCCPRIPGLFLYYSGHRHVPAGLLAFIEVLKGL
jgi:DNA-binding transcriptional LysR family regulator